MGVWQSTWYGTLEFNVPLDTVSLGHFGDGEVERYAGLRIDGDPVDSARIPREMTVNGERYSTHSEKY